MIRNAKSPYFKFWLVGIFLFVIFLDQVSKNWAQNMNWVTINSGISFSFFQPEADHFLLLVILLLFFMFVFYLLKRFSQFSFLSTVFVAAAFSNILDRILFSGVRDWLLIPGLALKNNLADWLMFLVVIVVIKDTLRRVPVEEKKHEYKNTL
ncbi:MAG: signal peptidase II [Patescibacteria group bacterium]